jgi:hypothetical protein
LLPAQQNNGGMTGKPDRQKDLTPEERAKRSTKKAAKELGLNDDQQVKWEQAALQRANANSLLRQKMSGSTTPEERKQVRHEVKSNNDSFDRSVTAFLTPEQKSKYDQSEELHHRKGGQKKKDRKDHSGSGNKEMD